MTLRCQSESTLCVEEDDDDDDDGENMTMLFMIHNSDFVVIRLSEKAKQNLCLNKQPVTSARQLFLLF